MREEGIVLGLQRSLFWKWGAGMLSRGVSVPRSPALGALGWGSRSMSRGPRGGGQG